MNVWLAIAVVLVQRAQLDHNYVGLFAPLEYRIGGDRAIERVIKYRLMIPPPGEAGGTLPLVVWLHGRGEAGNDNEQQLALVEHLVLRPPWLPGRYPFFMLAAQCPKESPAWCQPGDGPDMLEVVADLIRAALRDYPVDPDRVYLVGLSSGGTGCWRLAGRHPELFAAIAPARRAALKTNILPRWPGFPPGRFTTRAIEPRPSARFKAPCWLCKPPAESAVLTQFDGEGHDSWSAAFGRYDLLDWLFAQRRGAAGWFTAPGSWLFRLRQFVRSWSWWQLPLQAGILVVLTLAGRALYKRRGAHTAAREPALVE